MYASTRATIIGIAGCTNAGKSTLAKELCAEISKKGVNVQIIEQDEYYKQKEEVRLVKSVSDPTIIFRDYDAIEALDVEKLLDDTKRATKNNDFLIIEGNMITDIESLREMAATIIFLTIKKDICTERRKTRIYDPPDLPGYFDQIVWPSYLHTLNRAKALDKIHFVDTSENFVASEKIQSQIKDVLLNFIRIQKNPINVEETSNFTNDSCCGAISTFIGTTRNKFNDKTVIYLEYECYEDMAYVELRKICAQTRSLFPKLERIAIIHRIGEVSVGESSVVISTSSPHRKDAIAATEYLINEIKCSVPIWKKEVYLDGSCSWKENTESIQNNIT